MNDVIYWIMYALMMASTALNLFGLILSIRSTRRARKSWERAKELTDALAEIHDEYVKVQATEAFINTMGDKES